MMQEVEQTISAKGGIVVLPGDQYFIYDYIGKVESIPSYLWYSEGRKGITKAEFIPNDPEDKKSEKGSYYLKASEDLNFKLDEKPPPFTFAAMQKLAHMPDMESITKWLENKLEIPSSKDLFNIVVNYFKLFGDYEEDHSAIVQALNVFQSYLLPLLSVVFQVTISATFGAGKSTALKAGAAIAYHGILADSVSPASRVRLTEMLKPAWYQDELDSTTQEDDGLGMSMARTGYERGSYFVRWNIERNEPDVLEHFSTLTYSVHQDIANAALQSRALAEIELSRTKDFKLAIVNMNRNTYAPPTAEALFFWRFTALSNAIHDGYYHIQKRNSLDSLKNENLDVQKKRVEIYKELTTRFTEKEQALLHILVARESQLTYTAIFLERVLGVDVIQYLIEALNKRRQDEAEPKDLDFEEFTQLILTRIAARNLREMFAESDLSKADKLAKDSTFALKDVTREMSERIVGSGDNERVEKIKPEPKTRTVARWLKDLGFIRGKTWKHKRDGTYLTLTKELCDKIYDMGEPAAIALDLQKTMPKGEA